MYGRRELRDTFPAVVTPCLFHGRPGTGVTAHCLGASPLSAGLPQAAAFGIFPGASQALHLLRPNVRHIAQKERLPKAGSLTGEDCGVACRRLKATWQGLLPFRGRTGSGAVTRRVAGSDVLR